MVDGAGDKFPCPVPLSPEIKTGELVRAALLLVFTRRRITGEASTAVMPRNSLVYDLLGVAPVRPDRVSLVGIAAAERRHFSVHSDGKSCSWVPTGKYLHFAPTC